MPGVPDFYQGTELWDFSLVDPDNRRPVDFGERTRVLASLETPDWDRLVQDWPSGHLKLAWTRHLLKLRTELSDVFTSGDYQPLEVSGPHRDHVIAFARHTPRCRDRCRHATVRGVLGRRSCVASSGKLSQLLR